MASLSPASEKAPDMLFTEAFYDLLSNGTLVSRPDPLLDLESIRRLIVEPTIVGVSAKLDSLAQEQARIRTVISEGIEDLQKGWSDQHRVINSKIDDHESRLRTIEKNGLPAWAWSSLAVAIAGISAWLGHNLH